VSGWIFVQLMRLDCSSVSFKSKLHPGAKPIWTLQKRPSVSCISIHWVEFCIVDRTVCPTCGIEKPLVSVAIVPRGKRR
jgi:hypothetical protein